MIYQFSRFATEGKMLSKTEFENQLISWLTFNYPNQLHSENQLDLIFYNGGSDVAEKELTTNLHLTEITNLSYFKTRVNKTKKLLKTIEAIELPTRSDQQKVVTPFGGALSQMFNQAAPFPADCSNTDVEDITRLSSKFLKTDTDQRFFQVGNVMEAAKGGILWSLQQGPVYIGSDQEREKRDLLDELCYELRALEDLVKFWKKLRTYRIIPLVVVNSGKQLQESVDLQLSLPANVKLLMPEDIALPKYQDNLEKLTAEGGWIEALFAHHTDINVNAYKRLYPRPVDLKVPNILGSRNRDLKELAKYLLCYIFNFRAFQGLKTCNVSAATLGR